MACSDHMVVEGYVSVLQPLLCTTLSNLGQGKKALAVSQVRVTRHSRTMAGPDQYRGDIIADQEGGRDDGQGQSGSVV